MTQIQINLYHKREYEALAVFCTAMAAAADEINGSRFGSPDVGGIVGNDYWKTRTYDTETTAAQVAEKVEQEAKVETARKPRKSKEETKANISASPENRIDPESPETVAQDAADEKAEVDAGRDPEKPLTVEDVKNALSKYIAKFGMDNTKEDGAGIFFSALGAPPAGEAFWRMSILPGDQASLAKCVAAWEAAAAKAERTTS